MGGIAKCCVWSSVLFGVICVVFVLSLFLLPCMPPYVNFPDYTAVEAGPLSVSSEVLNGVEHMGTGELRGPEALALRRSDKHGAQLFTGLLGGRVVRVDLDKPGSNVSTVTRLGNFNCTTESEGERCGRPTGMQFHQDGGLYVLDAYHGLYRVNVDNGEWRHLAGGDQEIGGARVRLAYDLAVAKDGRVFWSDASTQAGPEDVLLELLAQPSGRLLRFDPKTNRTEMLIGLVHCATGVALSSDESFVLVAEAGKDRILRYYLQGKKAGTWDVFSEGLPGVPAKITRGGPGGEDGYIVTLAITHPSVLEFLRRHPALGKAMMRLLAATEAVFSAINDVVQNSFSRDVQYMLGNPQLVAPLLNGGAVVALNSSGHVIRSLVNSDGSAGVLSQLATMDDFAYLASPYNPFLGRLNLTEELRQNLEDSEINLNMTAAAMQKPPVQEPTTQEPAEPRSDSTPEYEPAEHRDIPNTEDYEPAEHRSISKSEENAVTEDLEQETPSVTTTQAPKPTNASQIPKPQDKSENSTDKLQESTTYVPQDVTLDASVDFEDLDSTTGTEDADFTEETTLSNQVEQFTATNDVNNKREPEVLLNLRDIIKAQVPRDSKRNSWESLRTRHRESYNPFVKEFAIDAPTPSAVSSTSARTRNRKTNDTKFQEASVKAPTSAAVTSGHKQHANKEAQNQTATVKPILQKSDNLSLNYTAVQSPVNTTSVTNKTVNSGEASGKKSASLTRTANNTSRRIIHQESFNSVVKESSVKKDAPEGLASAAEISSNFGNSARQRLTETPGRRPAAESPTTAAATSSVASRHRPNYNVLATPSPLLNAVTSGRLTDAASYSYNTMQNEPHYVSIPSFTYQVPPSSGLQWHRETYNAFMNEHPMSQTPPSSFIPSQRVRHRESWNNEFVPSVVTGRGHVFQAAPPAGGRMHIETLIAPPPQVPSIFNEERQPCVKRLS